MEKISGKITGLLNGDSEAKDSETEGSIKLEVDNFFGLVVDEDS